MLDILKVIFVIVGTIIGAGFSSGQEILTFFNKYGEYGIIGLIISSILIGIIIYKTLKISLEKNVSTYEKFIERIMPNKVKNNKILLFTINNIVNIFLLISFNVMVAGFSTFFVQEFSIPKIIGSIVIAILTFNIFIKGIDGVVKINAYLIPTILVLIIFLGIKKINTFEFVKVNETMYWIVSSILYASYNSICLIPILLSLKKYIKNKQDAKLVSIFTTLIMSILSLIIYLLVNSYFLEIINIEIPVVYIAGKLGAYAKYIYGLLILGAIFTTAISSGYGFLSNVSSNKKRYLNLGAVICSISIFSGLLGFSNLIGFLYPIFGYLGIIQIFFLLIA
ncbi:MAG: hypothetical protein J5507_01850 [Clostridia bacterium]|nr:hypothetical protein [Clostridia bacterium]